MKNTGIGGLGQVTVVDSLPADSSNVAFKHGTPDPTSPGPANFPVTTVACTAGAPVGAVCADLGSLPADNVENWSVAFDSTAVNVQNSASAAAGTGGNSPGVCDNAGTVCAASAQDSCSTSPTNSITVTKNCGVPTGYLNAVLPGTQLVTQSGLAAVQVNFSGDITNTGQTPLTGVALTDTPGATITVDWPGVVGTIAPGVSVRYSGNYKPSGVTAGDLGGAAGRYAFMDAIKVTGATATLGTSPGHDNTCLGTFHTDAQACGGATCNISPAGSTCSGN